MGIPDCQVSKGNRETIQIREVKHVDKRIQVWSKLWCVPSRGYMETSIESHHILGALPKQDRSSHPVVNFPGDGTGRRRFT